MELTEIIGSYILIFFLSIAFSSSKDNEVAYILGPALCYILPFFTGDFWSQLLVSIIVAFLISISIGQAKLAGDVTGTGAVMLICIISHFVLFVISIAAYFILTFSGFVID